MLQRAQELERESGLMLRVVMLKWCGGLSEREIASRLSGIDGSLTRRKVQSLLSRARDLARAYDRDLGHDPDVEGTD